MQAMVKRFRRSGPMRRLMLQLALGIALPMALWPLKLIYRQPQTFGSSVRTGQFSSQRPWQRVSRSARPVI